ncbi:unnamed protein product, partial [Adineta steineri]
MVKVRGWKVLEPTVPVIPRPPGKHRAILAPLPPSFDLYKNLVKRLQEAIPNCVVLKIEQIRNADLEVYDMLDIIIGINGDILQAYPW